MTDSTINRFLGQGDDAAEAAFTPDPPTPASGPDPLQLFLNTESTPILKYWDGDSFEPITDPGAVTTGTTLTSGQLVVGAGGSAVGVGNLSGAVTTSGGTATTLATGLNPDFASISLDGQLLQTFVFAIKNNAGTLQHAFFNNEVTLDACTYASKVTGQTTTYNNTPTVGAGTDFTAGAGIAGTPVNRIVINTAAQTASKYFGFAKLAYYSGNMAPLPGPVANFNSRNVNGTTRTRLEIGMWNVTNGSDWTINTTNIPSGALLYIRVFVFLA